LAAEKRQTFFCDENRCDQFARLALHAIGPPAWLANLSCNNRLVSGY
jgi:hypothetical protein